MHSYLVFQEFQQLQAGFNMFRSVTFLYMAGVPRHRQMPSIFMHASCILSVVTCFHVRVSFDTRGLSGARFQRSWGQMCSACFARSHDISERSDLDRWHLWSRINPWTMQLPETQSNELSLNKNPHKSSHVDVIHHCLWACGLIPLMWIGFQQSLSQFLRWWSHRKVSTAAVSPSCRPNRSTVQRVQRQIRWRRFCRRRSGGRCLKM